MATIGLKIADDPNTATSLSLADTLAKATFGDPEAQMKAKALGAEVGVRMASRDKLIADTGLIGAKTKTEQDAETARLNAGPLVGEAGASAVPAIVNPDDAHEVAVHNALVARERALGPVLVLGDNPNATAEGINKNYGGTILSAAAANPAGVSGDSLRIAGGLMTGSAPTTSTVWSAGDTAGVDAAAREKILEARGAPQKPDFKEINHGLVVPTLQPDGSYKAVPVTGAEPQAPAPPTLPVHDYRGQPGIVTLDANGNPLFKPAQGTAPTPDKPNIVNVKDKPYVITTTPDGRTVGTAVDGISAPVELKQQGDGYVAIDTATNTATPVTGAEPQPKIINVSKDSVPTTRQPDGSLKTVPTDIPPPAPPPTFQGKTAKDDALNRIVVIQQKIANKQPITAQEAALYESDYNLAYGTTNEKIIDPATGRTIDNQVTPAIPANTPTINDVRALVGTPLLPPPPPEPRQNVKAPSQEQAQLQQYAPQLVTSTGKLDKVTPQQVPSVLMQQILGVNGNDPSFVQQAIASTSFVTPQQRDFAQSVAEYNQSLLYMLSGKAITSDEYKRAMRSYIPLPGDGPQQLAAKADARHAIIASAVRIGWGNDPETGKIVKDNVKAQGIDLDKFDLTIPQQQTQPDGGGDAAPSKAPQAMKDAWSHMSADAKARAVTRYGQ